MVPSHVGCTQGWPDGDTCAECPGCAIKIWVPTAPWRLCPSCPGATRGPCLGASCLSWCQQCLPLSLCHLWLCWLWGEGLAGAPLCPLTPCPASLPARPGSWGQCHPSLLCTSINLLDKQGQEQALCPSVCLWHCPGASRGVQALQISSARWDLLGCSLGFVRLRDGAAGRVLSGQAVGQLLGRLRSRSALRCQQGTRAASGSGLHPAPYTSACCGAAPPNPWVQAGSVRVWAGSCRLSARAARGLHLLLALTPPCTASQDLGVLDLSQSHPVPPVPEVFPGEPGQEPAEGSKPNWGGFTLGGGEGEVQSCSITKGWR